MRLASFSCLALPLVLPLVVQPDFTGVTAEAGTKVTKTFLNNLSLDLVEVGVTVNGEEQELPDEAKPEVTLSDEEEITFVDEYVSVADGKATEILRTFTTLVDNSTQSVVPPGGEAMEEIEEGESDLQGETVRFVWDEDVEEFEISFSEDDGQDDSLLDDLDADADFGFLLSDEEMEVGSSWEIDVVAFDRISSPSGDLKINAPDGDDETDEVFSEAFRDGLDGTFEGTYESLEDGVATIVFEGEVTTTFEIEGEEEAAGTQSFEFTFVISGTLLWNMEAGVASEFQFGGDVEMLITSEQTFGEAEVVQTQLFEGEFESSATFE